MEDIDSYIKHVKKNGKKVRGKHSPISESVDNQVKVLKIINIYDLNGLNHLYAFNIKNHVNKPKKRIFIAISLASQSSDLLVNVARKIIKDSKDVKLVQYSLFPNTFRVNLIAMVEIHVPEQHDTSIDTLIELRKKFRKEMNLMAGTMP